MTEKIARQESSLHGRPKPSDFRLEETAIPTPASGQLLLGVQYLSLDPYMRGRMDDRKSYAKPLQLGEVMTGETVAQVLTSNHDERTGLGGTHTLERADRKTRLVAA